MVDTAPERCITVSKTNGDRQMSGHCSVCGETGGCDCSSNYGLLSAAMDLRDDLIARAERDGEDIVVSASAGKWARFCDAISAAWDSAVAGRPAR
jgi:hypothetical protein